MDWTCPHCDSINNEDRMRCACGYEISEEKEQKLLGVDIATPPVASDIPFQSIPILPAAPRHISRLRRAFWIFLGAIMLSLIFLLIADNYPQLILGPAPGAPQYDPQGDYASAQIMAGKLRILNYRDNVNVMRDIAEGAVFWTCMAGLVLFILVRKEEKKSS